MPDAERARSVNTLNKIFALGSITLTITVLWMVLDDNSREWKDYQKRFYQLEYNTTRKTLSSIRNSADYKKEKASLDAQMKAANSELEKHRKDYDAAQKKLQAADAELYKANQTFQFSKSRFLAARYDFETAASQIPPSKVSNGAPPPLSSEAQSRKKDLEKAQAEMDRAEVVYKGADARYNAAQKDVDQFLAKIHEVEKKRDKLNEQIERLEKKKDRVDPGDVTKVIRDAPLLDFMAPSLKIQQVVVDGVYNDLNFMRIPRVDRCMTCHMAYETKGYEGKEIKQPFRTHPKLDLFVGAKSKHPVERFGCTSCHQGRDRGTSFYTAVHWPVDAKQEKDWHHKYGWQEYEHWDTPMMPGSFVEAQCYKCHKSQSFIAEAPQLNRGRVLFERAGCYGCHKVQGLEGLRKAGPDLTHIGDKVTPEWAFKWVKDPKAFRPTTKMPKFFDLTNTSSPEDRVRNNVEARAMVSYLFSKTEKIDYEPAKASGDAAHGKELINSIGCLACHYVETPAKRPPADDRRMFGPTLDKLGSKTTTTWVYNWVKNPKHYFPDTYMPNLRLTDQEAMDITSYLMSLRDPAFEQQTPPRIDSNVLNNLARDYMKLTTSDQKIDQRLKSWSQDQKEVFLGERLIARYGCFGCHTIKGFEKAQNIGTELTEEGSKNIHQLDFGFQSIPHTRHDWFRHKLTDPRIFDMMPDGVNTKVKRPDEKLKMPNFQFSPEEVEALITFVLGLTKEKIAPELTRSLSPKEAMIEEGRRLVKKFNCQSCHILEGQGGAIRETIADSGFYPPILEGEGEMVKSDWLHRFLRGPTPIRPWLKVRMPTFNFNDTDLNNLTRYFAYMSNTDYPYENYDYSFDPHRLGAGKGLVEKAQCFKCHVVNGVAPPNDAANLAPDLGMARTRLRPQWIVKWLADPQKIKPGTRMPTFFEGGDTINPAVLDGKPTLQMEAIRDYLVSLGGTGPSANGTVVQSGAGRKKR